MIYLIKLYKLNSKIIESLKINRFLFNEFNGYLEIFVPKDRKKEFKEITQI